MQYKVIIALTSGRVSGVDVFSVTLLRGLLRAGIPAKIVLTSHDALKADAMPLPGDIPIERLEVARSASARPRLRAMLEYLHSQGSCIYLPNYDYRHSAVCAKLQDRVAAVGIVHSDDPMHYRHVARLGRYWNAIVAVSSKISENVARMDESFRSRLLTIPYGIPVPNEVVRPECGLGAPLRMLYVGRMEQEQKRVFRLITILDLLERRGIPCILTLVGAGPALDELRARAAGHVAAGRLKIAGVLANHQVGAEYLRNDVFLLTSAFEGLPVSLLESMAHGCVPVVFRTESGIPELIRDGYNGELIPEEDFEGFADRLAVLFADPQKRSQMSKQARATIVEGGYGAERMVEDYCDLFERVFDDLQKGSYRRRRSRLPLEFLDCGFQDRVERTIAMFQGSKKS